MREPVLPVELIFGAGEYPNIDKRAYSGDFLRHVETIRKIAKSSNEDSQLKMKTLYDAKRRHAEYQIGDNVLVFVFCTLKGEM